MLESQLGALWWPRGMEWGMEERSKREGLHVYIHQMHFTVQQKLTQKCKQLYPNEFFKKPLVRKNVSNLDVLKTQCFSYVLVVCCSVVSDSMWPVDCSPPGSSVHGILQARILEWVAISFSRGSSWPRDWTQSPVLWADSLPSELPHHVNFIAVKKEWKSRRALCGQRGASQIQIINQGSKFKPSGLDRQLESQA